MTPAEWLFAAAKRGIEGHSNYFYVVRHGQIVAKALHLQAALSADANDCTLYAFCEPTPTEIGLAEAHGIRQIFYGISKRDGKKLGIYRVGLRPIRVRRAREEILERWLPKW